MDAVSIRVPYKHLKQEVELVAADNDWEQRQIHTSSSLPGSSGAGDSSLDTNQHPPPANCSLLTLILSCTVAAGVQFGWALQLSLLTLMFRHWLHVGGYKRALQGPARALLADLSGPDQRNSANAIFCSWMAVGNILGFSAGASGSWHRWFPFLTSRACCEPCGNLKAAFFIAVVFLTLCTLVTLCFAKEIPLTLIQQHSLSDSAPLLDDHHINGSNLSKSRINLESNNYTLENKSERHYSMDNGGEQKDQNNNEDTFSDGPGAVLVNLLTSLRHLPPAMHSVLVVMALTWLSWFPFFLFDNDWMGREVFHGDPKGEPDEIQA